MPYQFMLLTACTIFKGWHDYPLYGRLYCYDNVWADTLLQQGEGKWGAWGNFDPFTWEGFGQAWITKMFWDNLWRLVNNTIFDSMFIIWYLANDDMVWCFPGEKINLFGGYLNGCNFFGSTYQ